MIFAFIFKKGMIFMIECSIDLLTQLVSFLPVGIVVIMVLNLISDILLGR